MRLGVTSVALLHVLIGTIAGEVREDPSQEKHGSNGLCPNSVSTRVVKAKRLFRGKRLKG